MRSITIFTPTYNREHRIVDLYNSLLKQTCKNFSWLIVDDGSSDSTKELVKTWIEEGKIDINYIYQENHGKMFAHNVGVDNTKTEYFVCVDSDDYLTETAVETIINEEVTNPDCLGFIYYKGLKDGRSLSSWKKGFVYETTFNAIQTKQFKGDAMIVIKTEVLKNNKFPFFEGEKFVPEAYLYDRLSLEGVFKFVPKILCICEYLEDGYSKNIRRVIAKNPKGYQAYITQRLRMDKKIKYKFLDSARYIAILKVMGEKIIKNSPYKIIAFFSLPLGLVLYFKEYRGIL